MIVSNSKRQTNSAILQSYWDFPDALFNHIQAGIFSRLNPLFNFYVKRIVDRQTFGAKFNLTYHNGAPVADILKLGILKLITNMALTIQNDVIIRKTVKKQICQMSAMQKRLEVILNADIKNGIKIQNCRCYRTNW